MFFKTAVLLSLLVFIPAAVAAPIYGTTEATSSPVASEIPPRTIVRHETEYRALAYQIAAQEGISGSTMVATIDCENTGWNPTLQSGLTYKPGNRWGFPAGTQEKSYGLAMIHLPDHPEITYEQATNPEWALTWMAKEFKAGRAHEWSCYRG